MLNEKNNLFWLGLAWLGLAWLGLACPGLAWLNNFTVVTYRTNFQRKNLFMRIVLSNTSLTVGTYGLNKVEALPLVDIHMQVEGILVASVALVA